MKKTYKIFALLLVFVTVIFSCNKEEMRYVDPMIDGVCTTVEDVVNDLNAAGNWGGALVGFRAQRIKLQGMKTLIETDGYTGDDYTLEDPTQAAQRVAEALTVVEFKLDSVWGANILNDYDAINPNSAGVVNFGGSAYGDAATEIANVYNWLMEESEDASETEFIPNDMADLQASVAVLTGLAALNDNEVIEYVNSLKAKFAEMKQQYADLASDVSSSPYFSKAQKEVYAALEAPLAEMETTINGQISLSTQDELDLIDRDLYALVYFVENNYTSPAQKPLVYGEISSITELRWLSEVATEADCTGDWVLTADIDAAQTHRWNPDADGPGFQQIQSFNGTFDGQFHIIHGLFMTKYGGPADNRAGLFNNFTGTIQNLGMVNTLIPSNAANGGQGGVLVGQLLNGAAKKCFTHGKREPHSQAGGLIGRPQGTIVIEDCFSAVDFETIHPEFSSWPNSGSFIGLPVVGPQIIKNCYTTGFNSNRVIFGHGASVILSEASGIYYDSETVGSTTIDRAGNLYQATSAVQMTDDGVVTDIPTANWNDLANFPGFSADTWEIKTVPEIDESPRPYLKGFNYDGLKDFIVPE